MFLFLYVSVCVRQISLNSSAYSCSPSVGRTFSLVVKLKNRPPCVSWQSQHDWIKDTLPPSDPQTNRGVITPGPAGSFCLRYSPHRHDGGTRTYPGDVKFTAHYYTMTAILLKAWRDERCCGPSVIQKYVFSQSERAFLSKQRAPISPKHCRCVRLPLHIICLVPALIHFWDVLCVPLHRGCSWIVCSGGWNIPASVLEQ